MTGLLLILLAGLSLAAFQLGRRQALVASGDEPQTLHSRPGHYGAFVAMWCGLPAFAIWAAWVAWDGAVLEWLVRGSLPAEVRELPPERLSLFMSDVRNLAEGVATRSAVDPVAERVAGQLVGLDRLSDMGLFGTCLSLALGGLVWGRSRITPTLRARNSVEGVVELLLAGCAALAILVTAGIVLSMLFEAMRFFRLVSPGEFLFGLQWSPQTALRADQVGSSGAFGAVPVFLGTAVVTGIAMTVAVPVGLLSAVFLSEYANRATRAWVKPMLEILAGIPTVVYGFFAALSVAPWVRLLGESLGLHVASESALAAGLVMGVMIIPFVSSLSDDVINAVPQTLRDGSYALGATKSETIRQVVLPAALPGIVGAVLLAVSRAIGETMIVVMAAGLAANLTVNPLAAVTTVTVQLVTLLVGDQEFDSAKTLAAFALGLLLFLVTLVLNVVALTVVRRYREKYD